MYIVYADRRFLTLTNSESLPEHSVYSYDTKCIFFILWISNCHANNDIKSIDYVIINVNKRVKF